MKYNIICGVFGSLIVPTAIAGLVLSLMIDTWFILLIVLSFLFAVVYIAMEDEEIL